MNNGITTLAILGFLIYISAFQPNDHLPYLKTDGTSIQVINDPKIEVPPADEWFGAKERDAALAKEIANKCQFFCEQALVNVYAQTKAYPSGYTVLRDSIRNAQHVGKIVLMDCKQK
jgi:hypothetical protein